MLLLAGGPVGSVPYYEILSVSVVFVVLYAVHRASRRKRTPDEGT